MLQAVLRLVIQYGDFFAAQILKPSSRTVEQGSRDSGVWEFLGKLRTQFIPECWSYGLLANRGKEGPNNPSSYSLKFPTWDLYGLPLYKNREKRKGTYGRGC